MHWKLVADALARGLIPECSSSWRSATNHRRRYCFWMRQPLVNVTRDCPQNRRCGRSVRRWRPPALRELGRAETTQCLRGKNWILFVGDSHARSIFNLLLTHATGRSPWPSLANATTDTMWSSLAWPASDSLGLCSGGSDERAIAADLRWNVSSTQVASSDRLGSSGSDGSSSNACTRDYTLPGTGTRLSFIFVGRLHHQWGQLCDLAHAYSSETTPVVPPPDAIVLSHSAWPMVKAPPNGIVCDATRYARDLRALLRLLTLGRQPHASVLGSTSGNAKCVSRGQTHHSASQRAGQPHAPMRVPDIYWVGQPRSQAPATQRCLASGAWIAAQQWALSQPISPSGDSRGSSRGPSHENGSSSSIRHLDAWYLVDEATSCLTTRECAAQPSPRMRDHVHYHWAAYLAIMQNLLNQLCA